MKLWTCIITHYKLECSNRLVYILIVNVDQGLIYRILCNTYTHIGFSVYPLFQNISLYIQCKECIAQGTSVGNDDVYLYAVQINKLPRCITLINCLSWGRLNFRYTSVYLLTKHILLSLCKLLISSWFMYQPKKKKLLKLILFAIGKNDSNNMACIQPLTVTGNNYLQDEM